MIRRTKKIVRRVHGHLKRRQDVAAALIVLVAIVVVTVFRLTSPVKSAGLDDVAVTLLDSEAVNTGSRVQVVFTFGTLVNGNTIKIYLGETTAGDEWQDNSVAVGDIACSDNGAGESYTVDSITAASASVPMWTQITATTVGGGATIVTCTIGDGSPNPINPTVADGYSIAVVTTTDSGAGIAYVGNANDVTVTAYVLPNLSLTIDDADGSACTTSSSVTSCNLGTVTTASVNTGNYDVNVGTNAASGASMYVAEDGNLRNGGQDIGDVIEGGTVSAGSEEYGVATAATASWTEQGDFTDDDTPIAAGPTEVARSAGPIGYSEEVAVTHRVAVDSAVQALTYSHIVTWTGTANF